MHSNTNSNPSLAGNFRLVGLRSLLLLGICLIAFFNSSHAQQGNDIVYLKDGSIIKGTLIEFIAGDHIRIKTQEGTVHQFPASKVQKTKIKAKGKSMVQVKKSGYFNHTSLGLMMGNFESYSNRVNPSLQMVNGFQFNHKFQAGLGTGLELFSSKAYFPIYGNFRYHLKKGALSPYVEANAGYTFPFVRETNSYNYWDWYSRPSEDHGGLMAGLNLGFRNYVRQNFGYSMSIGFRHQQISSVYESSFWNGEESIPYTVSEKKYMNRVELRFGFLFN